MDLADAGRRRVSGTVTDARGGFPRALALLGAAAMFLEILDATIVTTALPAIAADLGVAPLDATVVVTAYLITLAVVIPVSGWVADRFGVRRTFVAALVVFVLASVGCALTPSLSVLVAMRVVQAIGGALMAPVGRLAVLRAVERHDLVRAIAYLTWPALVAPVIAPLLGGFLVTVAGWRSIFAVNIPLGVVAVVAAVVVCPPGRSTDRRRLDWRGALGIAVTVGSAMVAAQELASPSRDWWVVVGGVAAALVVGVYTVRGLRGRAAPLLDLSVLRIRTFGAVLGHGTVFRMVVSAVPFLLPLMFQLEFGWSAVTAGAMVTAVFVGNVVIKPLTTPMMRRWGIRRVLVTDAVASIVGLVVIAAVGPSTPIVLVAAVLAISGALRSIGFSAYNTLAFVDVGASSLSDANAVHSVAQELGGAIGIALAAVVVAITPSAQWMPAGSYSVAFVVLAVALVPGAWGAIRLPRAAGRAALTRV
ncbi:MFS transporter [Gordonia soli]|uniref:Putative drug resistance transporter n=1 Tax=Gordonia soli NBRC 108243 TaxID=1223545 RepID=M0QDM6_9ACTN|nr:MFS transporter [Gordonia soli]GAC66708.1 putative drug resistance transporter [Gordonia soli NBRC 108243]